MSARKKRKSGDGTPSATTTDSNTEKMPPASAAVESKSETALGIYSGTPTSWDQVFFLREQQPRLVLPDLNAANPELSIRITGESPLYLKVTGRVNIAQFADDHDEVREAKDALLFGRLQFSAREGKQPGVAAGWFNGNSTRFGLYGWVWTGNLSDDRKTLHLTTRVRYDPPPTLTFVLLDNAVANKKKEEEEVVDRKIPPGTIHLDHSFDAPGYCYMTAAAAGNNRYSTAVKVRATDKETETNALQTLRQLVDSNRFAVFNQPTFVHKNRQKKP